MNYHLLLRNSQTVRAFPLQNFMIFDENVKKLLKISFQNLNIFIKFYVYVYAKCIFLDMLTSGKSIDCNRVNFKCFV